MVSVSTHYGYNVINDNLSGLLFSIARKEIEVAIMMNNTDRDQHFAGTFNILGEEMSGELIYNEENGVTCISLIKLLSSTLRDKAYGTIEVITGTLNTGAVVTLFHNRCAKNTTYAFHSQHLTFVAKYAIWSRKDATSAKYNKLVCVLENAMNWSGMSVIDTSEYPAIKIKSNKNENIYHWFGAKITFSVLVNNELSAYPRKEDSKVVERLVMNIEADEKQDPSFYIAARDKVISLISFAIRDNVNIEDQYLFDYDDYIQYGDYTNYNKHYLYTSERRLKTRNNVQWDYNFTLDQLLPEKDIQKKLNLLAPIFNLYLSLFKYNDMPPEMVFLNIVQALETFHARFFYNDDKDTYIASVKERFSEYANYPNIEKLLLSDTQIDENTRYIILVSRLNDLLIGKYDGLFWNYYGSDANYAQTIADTRHYYTHYSASKEKKALKGDNLVDAIHVLTLLLEYNICLQLGINNETRVRDQLSIIAAWKDVQKYYQKGNEQKNDNTNAN